MSIGAPPETTSPPVEYVLTCPDCQLPAGTYPTRGEAELLASVHDGLHHRGHPTAQITGGGTCESCTHHAAATWHTSGETGPAFQLCPSCHVDADRGQAVLDLDHC